jgi:hypothetical protein
MSAVGVVTSLGVLRVRLGLTKGGGGVFDILGYPFIPDLTSRVGERASLASIAVSLSIGAAAALGDVTSILAGMGTPSDEEGAGSGGPLDLFGRSFALDLANESGGHALPVWGAVSPATEAAACSAVGGVSRGDACAYAGLAVGNGAGWCFATGDFGHPFTVGGRVSLVLGATPLAMGLARVGASLGDMCACAGLAVGEGRRCGP